VKRKDEALKGSVAAPTAVPVRGKPSAAPPPRAPAAIMGGGGASAAASGAPATDDRCASWRASRRVARARERLG
jgi:hypothetical protein